MLKQIIIILGAVIVIEGLPYMASPKKVKIMTARILVMPELWLRIFGIVAVLLGLGIVYCAGLIE